jgi:hypothetical protein
MVFRKTKHHFILSVALLQTLQQKSIKPLQSRLINTIFRFKPKTSSNETDYPNQNC